MAIFDLYSKRHSKDPDIFVYDSLPDKLRTQIKYIIADFLEKNDLSEYSTKPFWKLIYEVLTREHGKPQLYYSRLFAGGGSHSSQVLNYLSEEQDVEKVLDVIEITFRCISKYNVFQNGTGDWIRNYQIEDVINDLNIRFKENGVGYKFENGIILKFDNELLHITITKPVLQYLTNPELKSINDEFLNAHEHFRHNNFKECINECLKAFESTMKIICHKKQFTYSQNDTSSKLIQILFDNNFVPSYLQTQLKSLRSTLESGIPTIRNKTSGHGKGVATITVDSELTSYTLNLTGSTIKFLLELLAK